MYVGIWAIYSIFVIIVRETWRVIYTVKTTSLETISFTPVGQLWVASSCIRIDCVSVAQIHSWSTLNPIHHRTECFHAWRKDLVAAPCTSWDMTLEDALSKGGGRLWGECSCHMEEEMKIFCTQAEDHPQCFATHVLIFSGYTLNLLTYTAHKLLMEGSITRKKKVEHILWIN